MRASPSFFSSNNGLAVVSEPGAETGEVHVGEITMDTNTALARAKALPIPVEFKRHLVSEESGRPTVIGANSAQDRIYTRQSGSQWQTTEREHRRWMALFEAPRRSAKATSASLWRSGELNKMPSGL